MNGPVQGVPFQPIIPPGKCGKLLGQLLRCSMLYTSYLAHTGTDADADCVACRRRGMDTFVHCRLPRLLAAATARQAACATHRAAVQRPTAALVRGSGGSSSRGRCEEGHAARLGRLSSLRVGRR